ncbi:A-kinase anchor protein 5 [Coturnix japonica]|uniref:A-kinase anchoring protein 5 n=1 Tax=Coturnix japonica TaxID=93934 RepID=A0A8C2SRQ6_COTJA|nr:A-kinase anchor protein 5 [Coturnix japonica]XP_015720946.1 A-kinase anchor protein 5 [Coturnix japonica]XP_015720947.1 A-kinase anchor protein 5 [Coturnix japonica]XP_015720948.1 A-kinase anchor protein 5 [Coturnix japonica]
MQWLHWSSSAHCHLLKSNCCCFEDNWGKKPFEHLCSFYALIRKSVHRRRRGTNMAKAAKEIHMENPSELETPSAGTPCPPLEEQAEKPSMLCFKKRKKRTTMKETCGGASAASEEKNQCISTDPGEAKASELRPSRGAWAALKSLTKPRRGQKSSSRKKVSSDSQVQLEMDAEESCAQGLPRKKAGSGVKMPCVRFLRGKKKPSPSEVVEESEDSAQANEVMGILNKAIEELEDMAPEEPCDKAESLSPLPAEDMAPVEPCNKAETLSLLPAQNSAPTEPCDKAESLSPLPAEDMAPAEPCDKAESITPLPAEDMAPIGPCNKAETLTPLPAQNSAPAEPCDKAESLSPLPAEVMAPVESCDKTEPLSPLPAEDQAPVEPCDKAESLSLHPAQNLAPAEPCDKTEPLGPLPAEDQAPAEPCGSAEALSSLPAEDMTPAEPCDKAKSLGLLPAQNSAPAEPCDKAESLSPLPAEDQAPAEPCGSAEALSPLLAEDQDMSAEGADADGRSEPSGEPRPDVAEHTECITRSEITSLEPVNEPVQEKPTEGSPHQSAAQVEEREVTPEAPVSTDQPNGTPEITKLQEIAAICKELPERDESERNTDLPEECRSEETTTDFSPSVSKDDTTSVQSSSSRHEKPEVNMGTAVGIVITITEAMDSDDADSDQAYEPSPVLHHNKQKGNKKSSGSFDFGQKEGPGAGSGAVVEEKGLGDQGHRTSDQYELLLIETASSLVKAAIQSSIEQLVNEMALEQNKHNSFL